MKYLLTTVDGDSDAAESIEEMQELVAAYINGGEVVESIIDEDGNDYQFSVLVKIDEV